MTALTITIPLPPKDVRNNARVHWARKAQAIGTYRMMTHLMALQATGNVKPLWEKAKVHITAYFPTARHMDPANLIDGLKGAFDGLEDAGVIVNDKNLWPERPVIVTKDNRPRVELTITKEDT